MALRSGEPYHQILVPVSAGRSAEEAAAIACRLAADRGATLTILTVIEVPAELPLEAQLPAEEDVARHVLAQTPGDRPPARDARAGRHAAAQVPGAADLLVGSHLVGRLRDGGRARGARRDVADGAAPRAADFCGDRRAAGDRRGLLHAGRPR